MNRITTAAAALLTTACLACAPASEEPADTHADTATETKSEAQAVLAKYTPFRLEADLSSLTDKERQMIPLLIEASKHMDDAFWMQAYGDKAELMASIDNDDVRKAVSYNYGPWDRLAGNQPFIEGVGPKPAGANYYPADITLQELEEASEEQPELQSLYTIVRRDGDGNLMAIPYSEAYAEQYAAAAAKLREAAELAEDAGLRKYLELRAEALLTDEYQASDLAWMDMKSNTLDVVIGPIETYEDQLVGAKAASEGYVLIKDQAWSERLARYASMLPALQEGLPVDAAYKTETPGTDSDLNAYDVVYYAGDCNAGSKTIAINLPNDEEVQLQKGTRRLQLKNAMRAKFDKILVPIAGELLIAEQRDNITFDAFFANTMFHEVAHGLGIKNTITGNGTVRTALKEKSAALEEGKADVLGLYMISSLAEQGELGEVDLKDYYTTFTTSIFRSIRFGSSSAHGIANLIRFNFFSEMGAILRDETTGEYRVDYDKMGEAVDALSERILTLQGDGDYDTVVAFVDQYGQVGTELENSLARLASSGIPVDIVFEQGAEVLGL